jgi:hypothetical protein
MTGAPAPTTAQAIEHSHRQGYLSPMRGEPTIVVENRKELTYLLSQAAELGLMCEYLYAPLVFR